MSLQKASRQCPVIGCIAARLLTIPVMAIALLACYVGLRLADAEPTLMADVSPEFTAAAAQAGAAPEMADATPAVPAPAARDAAVVAHEVLDPAGAGASRSP